MTEVSPIELKQAVEKTHGVTAKFLETAVVNESFQGKPVWQGIVHIFEIQGHRIAKKCYAWSSPVEGSKNRRFYAVLNVPPINSPTDAVRAAIVEEYRQRQKPV